MPQNQYGYDFYYAGNTFTRRFFLIDNISGVSNGNLKVIRVPTSISFRITQATGSSATSGNAPTTGTAGKIYMPVMDIQYAERTVDGYIDPSDNSVYASPRFNFKVQYVMSMADFWAQMQIFFSLTTAGVLLAAIYRTLQWSKRNTVAGESIDAQIIVQSVVNICGCAGSTYFWYLGLLSCYWFVFYKGQSALYLLIPTEAHDIYIFTTTLAVTTVTQSIYLAVRIYSQCKVNIFFFDGKNRVDGSSIPRKTHILRKSSTRQYLANNLYGEPMEIASVYEKVSIEFQLVWMYFALDGMAWQYAATAQPNIHDLSPGPRNPVLIFAVDFLVWIFLIALQMLFRYLVYDRFYRDRFLQYADLLSVSNISLIVFDEKRHGYYVHGRSVHQLSDTCITELNESLRKEEADMVPARGLDQSDHQVFEIFVTPEVRSTYDKIYGVVVSADPFSQMRQANMRLNAAARTNRKMKPADAASITAYQTVNKFLCSFFDKNFKEFNYSTRDKTYLEKLFGATPDTFQGSVFLHDPLSFKQVLLRGLEPAILICYALIFICIDISANSVPAAALSIYIIDSILVFARSHFGEQNLSTKTLLDWKFLV
ncbi:hypothetical protein BCR33DRAFT_316184 [Rhizoclosmatium globosum]|uniref:Meckelin n=1 Tax=Rhizoclosmatium globosum TaxID=329046 RepID=A0A1Y2CZ80_9FUNG|nr:hypothetical protein BCR33DRAFT_316184 [Rhizoclosmatium globosum]|eukprot:ORY52362.1 hypothetical protein BCR33DRAFT_316184 [Rhizoclosmatium globosum]